MLPYFRPACCMPDLAGECIQCPIPSRICTQKKLRSTTWCGPRGGKEGGRKEGTLLRNVEGVLHETMESGVWPGNEVGVGKPGNPSPGVRVVFSSSLCPLSLPSSVLWLHSRYGCFERRRSRCLPGPAFLFTTCYLSPFSLVSALGGIGFGYDLGKRSGVV